MEFNNLSFRDNKLLSAQQAICNSALDDMVFYQQQIYISHNYKHTLNSPPFDSPSSSCCIRYEDKWSCVLCLLRYNCLLVTIQSLNSNSIVKYIMESVITKFASAELLKEDNQTATEASSQFALDSPSFHQPREDNNNEEEPKRDETKLKYRKLKQKLNSIGFQHDDKCVVVKDFSSTKKQRIMKLALDLEKQIKVQNRDYEAMEVVCREIMKIVEAKRQLDLQLLRQSRFVPALFELLVKIPSLHKAELSQAIRSLELSIKILYVFASVSVNRQYLILTNRLNGLISFVSWGLGREEKKPQNHFSVIHYYMFKTINSLLMHKSKEQDTNNIVSTTIQLILCSPIFKKIKLILSEQFIQDDALTEAETVLELLRFTLYVLRSAMPKLQPDYIHFNQNNKEPLGHQTHLLKLTQFLVQFCFSFFVQLKQTQSPSNSSSVPQNYPTVIETALLLTIKIANCCFQTALAWLRKSMFESKNQNTISSFLGACSTIVHYCKHEMEQYNDNSQAKMLLNEIIILLAYLALDDAFVQRKAYEIGLLEEIFNLPVQYIMDSYLREVYIPSFCCLINNNKTNLNLFLKDNSPQPIIKLLKKELATHYSITKKSSTTSLMSMPHISNQYSSVSYQSDRLSLQLRFPMIYWQSLCSQLQKHV